MIQQDYFSIVNPENVSETQAKLCFDYDDEGGYDGMENKPVAVSFEYANEFARPPVIKICPQQLAELGALFLALAGTEGIDWESCDALLEGFDLKGKAAAKKLAKALEE